MGMFSGIFGAPKNEKESPGRKSLSSKQALPENAGKQVGEITEEEAKILEKKRTEREEQENGVDNLTKAA